MLVEFQIITHLLFDFLHFLLCYIYTNPSFQVTSCLSSFVFSKGKRGKESMQINKITQFSFLFFFILTKKKKNIIKLRLFFNTHVWKQKIQWPSWSCFLLLHCWFLTGKKQIILWYSDPYASWGTEQNIGMFQPVMRRGLKDTTFWWGRRMWI